MRLLYLFLLVVSAYGNYWLYKTAIENRNYVYEVANLLTSCDNQRTQFRDLTDGCLSYIQKYK